MVLTQMSVDPELQRATFKHYVSQLQHEDLYSGAWLNISNDEEIAQIPLHDLVSMLTNREKTSCKKDRFSYIECKQ